MQRRAFMRMGGVALAGGSALMPSAVAAEPTASALDWVSVKDQRFGAVGDLRTDDTKAIQAAADFCFGPPSAPHGRAKVRENKVLYFPPGNYRITEPIRFAKLFGARIVGSGRFTSQLTNVVGGSVMVTNGCGYSHFEGLCLQSEGRSATVFDLNWDGTPGGPALQSNTFLDMFFSSGGIGTDIGAGGFMGSENIFINCFWILSAVAGLKTSNFNALQNTVVGGNLQSCNVGVWVQRGSVCVIESVGFQACKEWDIRVDNSADDTINIVGCRSESANFVKVANYVHACLIGCSQTGPAGYFLQPGGCPSTVERCSTVAGQISLGSQARLTVRGSSFGRKDWLSHGSLSAGELIELEDIQFGGTPNRNPSRSAQRIVKQRITSDGVQEYVLKPA